MQAYLTQVEYQSQRLKFYRDVLNEERNLGNPFLVQIKDTIRFWSTGMSHLIFHEIIKIAKNTKCNATRFTPPSQRRGRIISNRPYDTTLHPYQGIVDKNMAEGGGLGAGAVAPLEPCCEAGKSRNRCVHHSVPGFPQQGTLCHTEDDSYNKGGYRIRPLECAYERGHKRP